MSDAGEECVLCSIRDGRRAARKLYSDELVYAIYMPRDSPYFLGPVHLLIVPNKHIKSALDMTDDDAAIAARMFTVAGRLARENGIAESGYRLATNVGPDANQTVFHFHLHCFGGRTLAQEG